MKKLSWTQRIALAEGIKAGKNNAQIARELGVHRATIGREIARNADSRESYAPQEADLRSWHRQKEAMSRRFLVTFCGVEFLSTLKKRNRIYTYISRTHLNTLSRYQDALPNAWESSYLQSAKERFMPAHAFVRWLGASFPAVSINTGFFGFSVLNSSSSQISSSRCATPSHSSFVPGLHKPVSSQSFSRMPMPSVPNDSKRVLYETKKNITDQPEPLQAILSPCPSPVYFKNDRVYDVSFIPEMKNYALKTTKNLRKRYPLATKI